MGDFGEYNGLKRSRRGNNSEKCLTKLSKGVLPDKISGNRVSTVPKGFTKFDPKK